MTTTTSTYPVITDTADLNQAWADAFNSGDVPRIMAFYAEDAVLVPFPGAEPVRGLAAIEEALRGFLAMGGTLEGTARHWTVCGDLAVGSTQFEMHDGHDADGNPVAMAGITVEVVRRQPDGGWKYVYDHPFGGSL